MAINIISSNLNDIYSRKFKLLLLTYLPIYFKVVITKNYIQIKNLVIYCLLVNTDLLSVNVTFF